jgi:hypothetical protein
MELWDVAIGLESGTCGVINPDAFARPLINQSFSRYLPSALARGCSKPSNGMASLGSGIRPDYIPNSGILHGS